MGSKWGDPKILDEIVRESGTLPTHLQGIFRRYATQIGLVESGGRNVHGGDADSTNFRQERAQGYADDWARTGGPYNTRAIVRRLKNEFLQQYNPGEKSWQVAAQVQRPREDLRGRYHDVAHDAAQILRARGGAGSSSGLRPASVTGNLNPLLSVSPAAGQQPQSNPGLLSLLSAIGQPQQAPPSTPPTAPAFTAAPAMAGAVPSSGGGPAPKVDPAQLLSLIQTQGGDVQHQAGLQASAQGSAQGMTAPGQRTRGGRVAGGRVVIDPNADRAGVPIKKDVVSFVQQVSAIAGHPLRIGTGTNHSRLTINGTESDHWRGEGADIPATGRRLLDIGRAALVAAGMSPAKARKAPGGLYNVGGYQIIFSASGPGIGDHTTHLHVGRRR